MYQRLNEIFPNWSEGQGIFNALNNFNVPWKSMEMSNRLDIAYHGNNSGSKIISPLVKRILGDDNVISDEKAIKIAGAIWAVYGENWSKLFKTLSFEYNPIENYDMTETEAETGSSTNTRNSNGENRGNVATTNTGTIGDTTNSTETGTSANHNDMFGFNSDNAVGADNQNSEASRTTNSTNTQTLNTVNSEDRNLTNTETINDSGSNSTNRTLTRHGNIGVTTSQQMLQSERDVWMWYFYTVVFRNIDSMLTLFIY